MNRALAAAYAHGPGKEITVGPTPDPAPAPGVRLPLPATDVARLLVDVLSPSRWEPWNQYNDHRSYPSPRAAYLVDVEIVAGEERWLFDPLRRATIAQPNNPLTNRRPQPGDPRTNGPLAPAPRPEPPVDHASPIDWRRDAPRVGWGNVYVGMAEEQLRVGDVEASFIADGGGAGTAGAPLGRPGLGGPQLDRADSAGPSPNPAGSAWAPTDQAGPQLDRTVRLEFVRRPDRLSVGYGQFADALTELEVGHVAGALVENAPRFGLRAYADGDGVTLEPGDFKAPGKLPKRSSGLGPRGLAADPRPLPVEILTAFIKAMEQLPEGTLKHPGLVHRLAVHNVSGARDGWYTVDVRRAGPAMDAVQDCHGHPRAVIDVAGMNLALVMAADVSAAVKAGGEGEYQALLRAAGALGQHVCTAAAKAGMFCRPLRSFDDPALEAAAGFPLSHSLLYVLLAGRPKVTGPAYDLSPLEAP